MKVHFKLLFLFSILLVLFSCDNDNDPLSEIRPIENPML